MKKKRSSGITILSISIFAWSPIFIFLIINTLDTFSQISIIAFTLCSIICGIALFRLAHWGRKLTVICLIFGIIYNCLYFSPVLYKQRIQDYEKMYKRRTSENYLKHRFDDEISRKDHLTRYQEWLKKGKKKKFDFLQMFAKMTLPGIFILYLCRSSVKKQFKVASTGTIDNKTSNISGDV